MTNKAMIAIPALNEASTIGTVIRDSLRLGLPVIVINDGSSDGTGEVARAAGADVIDLDRNRGVGFARRTAYRFAVTNGFDTVVECDADGQHPTADIERLLDALRSTGPDLVLGSRFIESGQTRDRPSFSHRLAMKALSKVASRANGCLITDSTSGFRAVREPLVSVLSSHMPDHYLGDTFEVLVAAGRAGYDVVELPVEMSARKHGSSSATTLQATSAVARVLLNVARKRIPEFPPRQVTHLS